MNSSPHVSHSWLDSVVCSAVFCQCKFNSALMGIFLQVLSEWRAASFRQIQSSKFLKWMVVLVPILCHLSVSTLYTWFQDCLVLAHPWNFLCIKQHLHSQCAIFKWSSFLSLLYIHLNSTKMSLQKNITNIASKNTFWQNGEQYFRENGTSVGETHY